MSYVSTTSYLLFLGPGAEPRSSEPWQREALTVTGCVDEATEFCGLQIDRLHQRVFAEALAKKYTSPGKAETRPGHTWPPRGAYNTGHCGDIGSREVQVYMHDWRTNPGIA